MTVQRDILLCRYHYDPLDRVASCTPLTQLSIHRYYRKNRLATEIQGQVQYSVIEHEAQLLAQQQHQAGGADCALLATDLQRSVLHSVAVGQHQRLAYSPYGQRSPEGGLISLLGFNGERRDPVTGHYLLGNGYRAFNPVLMRFNSPDSLSPFGKGGLNFYVYCAGEPVNRVDPTGHYFGTSLVSGMTAAQQFRRVIQRVEAVVSTSLKLMKSAGNGARSLGAQAAEQVGMRSNSSTWKEFSRDIASARLRDAVETHESAVLKHQSVADTLGSARTIYDRQLRRLDSIKQNPGTKAPVGSTEYEKLINEPTMSAFKAHRQVEALETQLKNASIDAFRTHLNVQRAQVIADIRKGN